MTLLLTSSIPLLGVLPLQQPLVTPQWRNYRPRRPRIAGGPEG